MLSKLLTQFDVGTLLPMVDEHGNNALHLACIANSQASVDIIFDVASAHDRELADESLPSASLLDVLFQPNHHGFAPETLALKNGHEKLYKLVFWEKHGFAPKSKVMTFFVQRFV